MAIEPRGYILRPPYRGRDNIRSLGRGGPPVIEEVGVDRLRLRIGATCRPTSEGNQQALRGYFESFPEFPGVELAGWFPAPRDPNDRRASGRSTRHQHIATRVNRDPNLVQTLGQANIRVKPLRRGIGWEISIGIDCNPTRTLSHLLTRFRSLEASDFTETIASLPLAEFFERAQNVSLSLDGKTNWVEDRNALVERLGTDPYATFLPIYLAAIQRFVEIVVSAGFAPEFVADGERLVLRDGGVELVIDTATSIAIPQSEVFIERYHGRAVAGMREAALRGIDQLRDVASTFYLIGDGQSPSEDRASIARTAGSLQLTTSLPHKSLLAIYPKSEKRMRFEIRRKENFSWGDSGTRFDTPMERILSRINLDRDRWVVGGSALRWENVFALFAEPKRPHIGDIAELIGRICDVATRHGAPVSSLVQKLIEDGGIEPNEVEGIGRSVLEALRRAGVVDRVLIARRSGRASTSRYVLREHHLTVVQEMALLPTIRDVIED